MRVVPGFGILVVARSGLRGRYDGYTEKERCQVEVIEVQVGPGSSYDAS